MLHPCVHTYAHTHTHTYTYISMLYFHTYIIHLCIYLLLIAYTYNLHLHIYFTFFINLYLTPLNPTLHLHLHLYLHLLSTDYLHLLPNVRSNYNPILCGHPISPYPICYHIPYTISYPSHLHLYRRSHLLLLEESSYLHSTLKHESSVHVSVSPCLHSFQHLYTVFLFPLFAPI
jgi:hypothetical protein